LAKRILPRQSALRNRLDRTGKKITIGTYALITIGVCLSVSVAAWLFGGLSPVLAMLSGFIAGVAGPHLVIGFLGARRKKKFLSILPDAIDLMVRGLKSGLPVTESIAAVGAELAEPVGTEFRRISDSVRFGQQLETAVWETAKRMDTPEFNFFVISMSIQRETGGNLAEALGNLSDILRARRQMQLKVKSMSSEARASAYILGFLPFIMFGIVNMVNPGYAGQLFADTRGLIMVGVGLTSLIIGVAIMAKMVRFEI
jgi:tight adherence protein B